MTEKLQLYRCNICNNLVEVLIEGNGELICCDHPMELITEHESEVKELNDKHVPVIEKTIEGVNVRVGAVKHPMTEEHHIIFIQAISKDKKYIKTKYLDANKDEAELNLKCNCPNIWSRALCNIHGLFKGEYNA